MENAPLSRANSAHAARLDRTLKDLRKRVEEQEEALEKVFQRRRPVHVQSNISALASRFLESCTGGP